MNILDSLLNRIHSPEDLQGLSKAQLNKLCSEIRGKIIKTVSTNGGHLASNLGVVELSVALHYVFHEPGDKIVWDVGHQAYTHKILTGRNGRLSTIRTKGGLSGFPNKRESPYDPFTSGHSSASISSALGLAKAMELSGTPGNVVAVIGDGALTGGLAYEGLNNAGRLKRNFIIVLNDNKMSISRNVGAMARYLTRIRTKPSYFRIKGNVETVLDHIPGVGRPFHHALARSKSVLKQILYNSTIFEDMGFHYYGPFDGHDIAKLIDVFKDVKNIQHPVLLHIRTRKGKGYQFAEENPGAFHGVSCFDVYTGKAAPSGLSFSDAFGNNLCSLAGQDSRICAVTAAMRSGTGLTEFAKSFPERFYDVGIEEEHAVTFCGGLAAGGMIPVFAVYSTFLQRGYDEIIHDIALQNAHVVFAIDRAGIVGEDGETHQGIFDTAFLCSIPGVTVFAPCYYDELKSSLFEALYSCGGLAAVRYPRGAQPYRPSDYKSGTAPYALYGPETARIAIVTYGRLFSYACKAFSEMWKCGVDVKIIKLNIISPVDANAVQAARDTDKVFFFEEGIERGGVGERFCFLLQQAGFQGKYFLRAIGGFVVHQKMQQALSALGLDEEGMIGYLKTECAIT